ncbi:MAG: inositol monophosphatase family protein [Cyanobacteria bacterium]|nr:inositol monophosphatase family protein [Cyanobacteriota bacterium]MDW8200646.1 inositol monophosphatase family protein [Cyanobacteriota bacterium SKYGB_h_bin112]
MTADILPYHLQVCHHLYACGRLIKTLSTEQVNVSEKGPEDYVTNIDHALDQYLTAAFGQMFPQDGIITEENALSRQLFYANYDRLWLIDPLDGTEDFIAGKADYAVMVGVLQGDQPVAGWIYAPAYNRLYYGGSQWGLFQIDGDQAPEPLPIQPPQPPSADPCPMILGDRDRHNYGDAIRYHLPTAQLYTLGSFGLKVLEVIQGRAGLYVYLNGRVKLWDTTGPLALAQAAGIVCCDLEGNPISFQPHAINPDNLAHRQPIVIGWQAYIDALLPKLQKAVSQVRDAR